MTEQTPDQAEVEAIALDNKEVFHRVFNTYYESLCDYAFTILKDQDEGEDVVQSIFLNLWEQGKRFDANYKLKAYLFKSVYHRCINQLEHRAIRLKHRDQQKVLKPAVQQPEVLHLHPLSNQLSSGNRKPLLKEQAAVLRYLSSSGAEPSSAPAKAAAAGSMTCGNSDRRRSMMRTTEEGGV
jgi:RNA polymerase sigma factor (sigma-70 family)